MTMKDLRRSGRLALAGRIREIRVELFGEDGGQSLADALQLPLRTWQNYEAGVTLPAEIVLGFVELTGANPAWLLWGVGRSFASIVPAGRNGYDATRN
jgi:hypothetical protein